MVTYCCVKDCGNNSNKTRKDSSTVVSFHALPSNPELRAKWLRAVGRPNWTAPSYAKVCSVHFDHDQINYDGHRVRLKDDAVPINLLPYNANFEASDVEACRICLATDIKLYSLQGTYLATCMQALVGVCQKGLDIDVLPQYVCCLCTPGLVKCKKLIEQCMKSQKTLLDIFTKHGRVSQRLIKEQNSSQSKQTENEQLFKDNDVIIKDSNDDDDDDDENIYIENGDDSNTYIYTQIVERKKYKTEENDSTDIHEIDENDTTTVCEDSFDKELSLQRQVDKAKLSHIKKALARKKNITKAYRCEQCDMGFDSEISKRVHMLTSKQHRNNPDLSMRPIKSTSPSNCCKRCGEEFSCFRDVMSHMKAQHPRPRRQQHPWRGDKPYPLPCEICGEIMTGRKKHWLHVLRHHPKHVNTYHAVITAVCDTCGKGFQNSTKLRVHQLRHRSPTLQCDSCPRLFYDKYMLARHARVHSAEKPHVCRTCGRAFKQQSNLDRHYKVHTDIASYECTICNKTFKYSSSRNFHIRTVHQNVSHPTRKKRSKSTNESDGS